MSKEAETSHSQPLPHFRSFRSDLHLHSSVVQCHSRKQQLIGMTPERGRNAEGRGQKWDAFPILANVENVLLSEVVDGCVTKNDGIADYRAHCRNHLMDSSVFEQLFRLTLN